MTNYTRAEAIKLIRKTARDNGMTFKRQRIRINGHASYCFVNRQTGVPVIENMLFWTAWENCMSGYIASRSV